MVNVNKYINSRKAANIKNKKPQAVIKCHQINLQHSRTTTDNLMELIEKEGIDVAFIKEPCTRTVHKRVVGITKIYRAFTSSVGRCRTATVVTNN